LLSPEAEFLSKYLYCRHLVAYHSINMTASEVFRASPLSATTQNSMERQTVAQQHHVDINFCILESFPFQPANR